MSILDQIVEEKKEEVSQLRKKYTLDSFRDMEFFNEPSQRFYEKAASEKNLSLVAEIKKASPSKGIIRENFDHLKIADIYMRNEVDAISILTDKKFFKGDILFLKEIAAFKNTTLLRKDFIIDELQVFESKANGADVILLISEILSKDQINELTYAALETGLEVLLEIHSEDQIDKIDFEQNKIIGINNRDLKDFSVDINTTKKISEKLPDDILVVSESGISSQKDFEFLKQTKTKAVLIGEHFMKTADIESSVTQIKEWCRVES